MRTGLLYRSTTLNRLAGDDADAFARLGIRSVYDLRTAHERNGEPDRLPAGTEYVVADVIGTTELGSPAQMMGVMSSPDAAREVLGDGRGEAMWADHYRHFVILDSARAAYGRLFSDVASGDHRPALFHCSTGKDRTGWAAAAFLMLLGVPDDLVVADFMRSLEYLAPLVQPFLDQFAAQGGDPELLSPIFGLRPHYLEAGVEQMRRSFGTVEDYFADGLGIGAGTQRALREAFVTTA